MIGIDTNILVRYFLNDDPERYAAAVDFMKSTCTGESEGMIHLPVLCEFIWVLTRSYKIGKPALIELIDIMLNTEGLRVQEQDLVKSALHDYKTKSADLADLIIGKYYRRLNCKTTATFDRGAAKLNEFTLVGDD